jgi:hypothetical protein
VFNALIRLVNDPKASTRSVAVTEIQRLVQPGPLVPELQAAVVRQIPTLSRAISFNHEVGVLADLCRIAGEIGGIASVEITPRHSAPSEKQRGAVLQELTGAIVGKLYGPWAEPPRELAAPALIALARFAPISAPLAYPLVESYLKKNSGDPRVSHAAEILRCAASAQPPAEVSSSGPGSAIIKWLGLRGIIGKASWGPGESEAVTVLMAAFHSPPPFPAPSDPAAAARITSHEERVHREILTLERFGVRTKGTMPFSDSLHGSISLASCLGSPMHSTAALQALRAFGPAAAPAIPAILEAARARGLSDASRGEALEVLGALLSHSPALDFSDSASLGGHFFDLARDALHRSSPFLIQKTLQGLISLGSRAQPLASAVEYALRESLVSVPSPGEQEDAALEPLSLVAIETLAAIDPSGETVAQTFSRIFTSHRTPDDIRLQLILAVEDLTEREELALPIADAVMAQITASRDLAGYLVEECYAMYQRIGKDFRLNPAELPQATSAFLRAPRLDLDSKEEMLRQIASSAAHHPYAVKQILMSTYKDISPFQRLDDLALETLRRLDRSPQR